MTDLDDRLREHFAGESLDDDALARIVAADASRTLDMARVDGEASRWGSAWRGALNRGRRLRRRAGDRLGVSMLRYAALGVLLLTVGVGMRLAGSIDERGDRAMREVAMNHATRLTFEFEGESLASLDERMDQLPFALDAPGRLPADATVLGSRYCSLSGQLAAHVKLRDAETGQPISLFVTRSAAELDRLRGERGRIDGVQVELFSEGGLFYALARQAG